MSLNPSQKKLQQLLDRFGALSLIDAQAQLNDRQERQDQEHARDQDRDKLDWQAPIMQQRREAAQRPTRDDRNGHHKGTISRVGHKCSRR